MSAVAILSDQHFRLGLPATSRLLPKPVRCLQEHRSLRRHVVVSCALQDMAHLPFQRAVIRRRAPLEPFHHVVIQMSHVDRRHRLSPRVAITLITLRARPARSARMDATNCAGVRRSRREFWNPDAVERPSARFLDWAWTTGIALAAAEEMTRLATGRYDPDRTPQSPCRLVVHCGNA